MITAKFINGASEFSPFFDDGDTFLDVLEDPQTALQLSLNEVNRMSITDARGSAYSLDDEVSEGGVYTLQARGQNKGNI